MLDIKQEEQEVGQEEDRVIVGAKNIEDFLKRSYISIVTLRASYGLPMKKRGDFPSLSMAEFRAWCKTLNLDPEAPEKLTVEVISDAWDLRQLESFPDTELRSFSDIVAFTKRPANVIQDWIMYFSDCPIQKGPGNEKIRLASVRTRALVKWMHKRKISRSPGAEHTAAEPYRY